MASYQKLKSDWQYRLSYYTSDGQRRQKSASGFRTKREAEIAAREIEQKLDHGINIDDNPIFVDYMQQWYTTFKKGKYSKRNDRDIELSINTARKFFKKTKIKTIDRAKYQSFINWYGQDHANASVRKIHTYCKQCLQDAYNDKLIDRDPTYRVMARGQAPNKDEALKYLSVKETEKLIAEVKAGLTTKSESRYMILIALATGMRYSEILALQWSDIDFDKQTISITKTFDYTITKQIQSTKTKSSVRTITVDRETLNLLREYQISRRQVHPEYLFIDTTGEPSISNTACNKMLKRCCQRAGIKEITFHGLRHTHCSLLLYRGVDIKYISQRLGHSDVSITYSIYAHVIDELSQTQNDIVNDVMENIMHS
ncbi:MAG: site-specific integrase [Aerococcus sp.]|nr:site-specific integrase [Aerococcus sp.]